MDVHVEALGWLDLCSQETVDYVLHQDLLKQKNSFVGPSDK
jgi:hypothetical protein